MKQQFVDDQKVTSTLDFLSELQTQVKLIASHYEDQPAVPFLLSFQAAVLLKARSVQVHLGRDWVQLQARVHEQPSLVCSQQGFWQDTQAPGWQKKLRRALLLLQAQGWRDPFLQIEGPKTVWKFTFQGGKPKVESSPQPTAFEHWRVSLRASFKRTWWNPRAAAAKQRAELQQELGHRLSLSPVVWRFDGASSHRPAPESIPSVSPGHTGPWLAEALQLSQEQNAFAVLSPLIRAAGQLTVAGEVFKSPASPSTIASQQRAFLEVARSDLKLEGGKGTRFTYFRQFSGRIDNSDAALFAQWKEGEGGLLLEELYSLIDGRKFCISEELDAPYWSHDIRDAWGRTALHLRVGRWLGLPTQVPASKGGLIFYYQDGVLLNPIEVRDAKYPYRCILARGDVATDFSGLNPELPPNFAEDCQWADAVAQQFKLR